MKKVITYIFLVFSILSFSNTFNENEDERTILRKEQRLEQERIQEKYENSKDSYQKDTKIEVDKNELKFYISKINLFDDENLLNEIEKENILSKYENKKLGSTDISNILVELTNRLIEKGYVTSTASLSENNNLNSETLNLKIISGKIEKIILNEDDSLDKLKKYFLVSTKEEKVLNVRDLDTTTENFNYLEANNMTMEIIPSDKENYSIIKLKNEMKDKFTISLLTNNYGEDNQNGIWRGGTSINIDSPLGIGDRVYFSYMTVHKKKADRSWKRTTESLKPGEILPIGPKGYDPAKDTLPYKRELDLYNFRYTMKFRDYTLSLGSSRSENISSFYTPTTIYDMETMSSNFSINLDKILWRNQKSKLSLGVGLKRKHNKSYIEDTLLSDRILTIGDISLNGTTVFYGGIFGITLDYERGLRALGASNTPKAEFKKYSLNLNYYKPLTKKLVYRFNTLTSHSKDVLYASEKQSIGGVGSVPGYHRRGNIMGDRAIEIENELSYKIIDSEKIGRLSPYISYSYGAVRNNKNPSVYGKGYVSGASIGLRYSMKYLDIDLGYAKALSHSSYIKPRDREIYFSTSLKIRF
ncbi:ShlB/FhaC/HecB family hemolysin secretion/activation protein [Fusobacterium pseudoperiodonticum]|uniref:Hemolysin activator protein n=2 Tax=Fusobacterium TaxID=848 RepID=A0AAD0AL15_9FUSO|nr:ShlB/FhaC/HecB family hemolysin secretion/activation protein [Fusobacterium pseudoperiodonticum]ATV35729.1 hemolysin activator protein precursor [Fusobacterium pseudoperiodonticum]ATV61378.1 hemolysin activator protein precursor [Fusobacterium pseudoperiodonticum]